MEKARLESSPKAKGFRKLNKDHRLYYYYDGEKQTAIRTKVSHGNKKYKVLGPDLITKIRKQMHLDTNSQVKQFVECSMTAANYRNHLESKNLIPQ